MRTRMSFAALAAWLACAPAHAEESSLLAALSQASHQCKIAADANDLGETQRYCSQANALRVLPENYVNLGSALYAHGRYEEAQFFFIQAVNINPNLGVAHFNLARAYEVLGKKEEAHEQYRQAASLGDPDAAVEIASKSTVATALPKQ